jgi:hypothetical protein
MLTVVAHDFRFVACLLLRGVPALRRGGRCHSSAAQDAVLLSRLLLLLAVNTTTTASYSLHSSR